MEINYTIVEAFTIGDNQRYTGNPAAVCFLETDDQIPDDLKQKIANTMNLSETAFVSRAWTTEDLLENPADDQDTRVIKRTVRWFTPTHEVPLCGHATLATSRAVKFALEFPLEKIEFKSKFRGILNARLETEDRITLDFPANVVRPLKLEQDGWISDFSRDLLGDSFHGMEDVMDFQYCVKEEIALVRLHRREHENPEKTIQRISPNFEKLKTAETGKPVCLVIVTMEAGDGERKSAEAPHFYSRVFAPWLGVNEDPVCGIAHTIMTPYWADVLGERLMNARQASVRQGDLRCELLGDRVELSGRAKVFCTGVMRI